MMHRMLTETAARQFAESWVLAWSSHDLDGIMSHYGPEVILTSPVAAERFNDASGTVTGQEALRSYFKQGLEAYPNLTFELLDVMWGISSVVLYYLITEARRPANLWSSMPTARSLESSQITAVDGGGIANGSGERT
jgi:hypothetical protein